MRTHKKLRKCLAAVTIGLKVFFVAFSKITKLKHRPGTSDASVQRTDVCEREVNP